MMGGTRATRLPHLDRECMSPGTACGGSLDYSRRGGALDEGIERGLSLPPTDPCAPVAAVVQTDVEGEQNVVNLRHEAGVLAVENHEGAGPRSVDARVRIATIWSWIGDSRQASILETPVADLAADVVPDVPHPTV
jgi:hypothetical protein